MHYAVVAPATRGVTIVHIAALHQYAAVRLPSSAVHYLNSNLLTLTSTNALTR